MQPLHKRQDYFLLHPPRQPKREIAIYAWKNRILVPEIFTSFKWGKIASNSGMKIRARSEHPQDYFGVSGLVDSPLLSEVPYVKKEEDLKDTMRYGQLVEVPDNGIKIAGRHKLIGGKWINDPAFKPEAPEPKFVRQPMQSTTNVLNYFAALRLPQSAQDDFWNRMSFSYWEEMEGHNLTVVADSAIAGRYHVMVRSHRFCGYLIFEDGKTVYRSHNAPQEILESGRKVSEFYESVRTLPKFDPCNCPIMEAQLFKSEVWFLQYLRGQRFEPAEFRLERPPAKNELVAEFVRGASAPGGSLYRIKLYNNELPPLRRLEPYPNQDKVDGAFDISMHNIFRELSLRAWQVGMTFENYGIDSELRSAITHNGISRLFKPKISLIFKMGELEKIGSRHNSEVMAWLESDGNKAYLKIL